MVLKNPKSNKSPQRDSSPVLKKVRKNVYRQALLAGLVILLTVVILFAITAAWYTNIIQSSGLVLETAEWGFDGTVTLGNAPISAAPGDKGVIELTAVNNSDLVTEVGISVSKAGMDTEMQKRIYFYVDAQDTRNGEIVDRVYLNSAGSYTYTMFSQGTLLLTESVYNNAQLKWQWVRDVLGYYVLGTATTDGNVKISEYLRPIEYDYDAATTAFAADGKLESINGQSVEEFLLELSAKDGYSGEIRDNKTAADYYPVEVDDNGYGVWVYLCTKNEIEVNNAYDTALGDDPATVSAVVTITAQNSEMSVTDAYTAVSLLEAINAARYSGASAVIRLADNVTLDAPLTLSQTDQIMLDLNGKTLTVPMSTYDEKEAGIQAGPGSSITIVNGIIAADEPDQGIAVYASGAEVTMSNVTIENVECALYVRDEQNDVGADSRIRIVGSTFAVVEEGIYLSGNGSSSERKTQLIVENSTINSGYVGIMGNGNTANGGQWGTDVQIINSTVGGRYAGIYQPQKKSTLTVSGDKSSITGYTGIVLKGGWASIEGGTVQGTGALAEPTSMPNSGFNDTGDGIYIETNYGYEIVLEINGERTKVTSENALALRVYEDSATNVSVKIYSGTFSSDVASYVDAGSKISEVGPSLYTVTVNTAVDSETYSFDGEVEAAEPEEELGSSDDVGESDADGQGAEDLPEEENTNE